MSYTRLPSQDSNPETVVNMPNETMLDQYDEIKKILEDKLEKKISHTRTFNFCLMVSGGAAFYWSTALLKDQEAEYVKRSIESGNPACASFRQGGYSTCGDFPPPCRSICGEITRKWILPTIGLFYGGASAFFFGGYRLFNQEINYPHLRKFNWLSTTEQNKVKNFLANSSSESITNTTFITDILDQAEQVYRNARSRYLLFKSNQQQVSELKNQLAVPTKARS